MNMRYIGSGRLARRVFFALLLASFHLCYGDGVSLVGDQRIMIVNADSLVAAHRTYPVGTYLKIANAENGMEILVEVIYKTNDLAEGEVTISAKAARQLGLSVESPAQVTIWVNGQTDRKQATIVFPTVTQDIAKDMPSDTTNATTGKDEPATGIQPNAQPGSNVATSDKDKVAAEEPKAIEEAVEKAPDGITATAGDASVKANQVAEKAPDTEEKTRSASGSAQVAPNSAAPSEPKLKDTALPPAPIVASPSRTEKRWRVYLGAFGVGDNAKRFAAQLREDGFNPSIEKAATYTFVMIADVHDKDLRPLRAKLNKAGYSDQNIQQESGVVAPSEPRTGDIPIKIMGRGKADFSTLLLFLKTHNPNIEVKYAENVIAAILDESDAEGVNHDIAFIQMCQITNFLRFGGLLTKDMNNFGGIGAVSVDNPGEYFDSIQEGVRAQIQHLKVYASREPLKKKKVDPRYDRIVALGLQASAKDIYGLAKKWAADPDYGCKLFNLLVELYKLL